MAANGSYANPAYKNCWETCQSCYRCARKGEFSKCNSCSGRFDLNGCTDPDPDDFCDCRNGVLRYKRRNGQLVVTRFKTNPFKGEIKQATKTQDEADWDSYVHDLREKFDNPDYNPIEIVDT